MSERIYYVICEDNCKFESMTKEQIVSAIAASTGHTPSDQEIDSAFITKIKEMNANNQLQWWVGTEAQYNAISEKDIHTLYIITDSNDYEDLVAAVEVLENRVETKKIIRAQRRTLNYYPAEPIAANHSTYMQANIEPREDETFLGFIEPDGYGLASNHAKYTASTIHVSQHNDDYVTLTIINNGTGNVVFDQVKASIKMLYIKTAHFEKNF